MLSRALIVILVPAALGTLLWAPGHPVLQAIDVLLRTYLMFLGTVMAHEGSHGHLGRGRAGNSWWGRMALLPVMVPYTNFRKTHPLHHAFTNDPDRDPDHFVRPRRFWQIPLRALAMPHQWLMWLDRHGRVDRRHMRELLLEYAVAIKTHEGWSLGAPEARSHDYYGRFMYWFSAGLALHRAHHLHPELSWLELRHHVERAPAEGRRWLPRRKVLAG